MKYLPRCVSYFIAFIFCFSFFSCASQSRFVTNVIDGDTIVTSDGMRIRYIGLNTPEKGQKYYQEALEFNRKLVQGKEIFIEFDEEKIDSFGRSLAYVYVQQENPVFVNEAILKTGFAMEFYRSPNGKYRKILKRAEEEAKRQGLHLFQPSPYQNSLVVYDFQYDAEGDDNQNINGEWIVLGNTSSDPIHLQDFYFYDESFHQYIFPEIILESGKSIKIFTGSGENTDQFIYAGFSSPIWNNSGDSFILYDFEHRYVLEESY